LEAALRSFPGTLLLVSHDRALLDAIGTRTVALEDHTLHSYVGGWPEYVRVRAERSARPAPAPAAQPAATSAKGAKGAKSAKSAKGAKSPGKAERASGAKRTPPARTPSRGNGAARLEAEIEVAERALAAVEDELADPAAWASPSATARSAAKHEAAQQAVAELYERYETVAG
ncbi:MAG TPA: ABC transporter ATP-binding protein, partial [Solirubrobacteraceae bacterium]|nr:ABC transporter ATP-binding protein [Solirubrobacteraceae bacterium]